MAATDSAGKYRLEGGDAPLLVWVVVVAALAGAAGLVHRRAWPATLVLLPLGAYLVVRRAGPRPPS